MKRALLVLLLAAGSPDPVIEDQLARYRNLGKAFFENPTTHPQAVEQFRKAFQLAPSSARERLNLGLALLANGQTAEGVAELEKVQRLDSSIPHTWFNLAVQAKKSGDFAKAQVQFEGFLRLVPGEAIGHYNLGSLHKLAGRMAEAAIEFESAMKLDPNLAAPHFQLYNLYRQSGRGVEAAAQLKLFQQAKERQANSPVPEDVDWSFYSEILDSVDPPSVVPKPIPLKFSPKRLSANTSGFLVLDIDAVGRPDVLPYSSLGPDVLFAAAGDFNNDGYPDIAAITVSGAVLFVNEKGKFSRKVLPVPPGGKYTVAVWLDYDHDYDLDLLLMGETNTLLRNQGESGFADRTSDFPFVKGVPDAAMAFRLIPDSKSMDLAVTYLDRRAVLYRDKLAGNYTVEDLPAQARLLDAVDLDANGTIDLLTETHILHNENGGFRAVVRPNPGPAVLADFDNRGVAQLHGPPELPPARSYRVADFDLDGKLDVVVHRLDGSLDLLTNQTQGVFPSMRVALAGVKNLKLAPGAEVEVKVGRLYRKQVYDGYPLLFGVRGTKTVDAVRITWPNGLIQSEANQSVKPQTYKEAQRLSGSCPQVWTWNGSEFEYVTDVLGVAPLGAMAGDGTYFPVDHLEHIQLPALTPKDGFYEIRLTEELAEVAFLDQVRLIAVDESPVAINEKFQSPPYPDLKIYSMGRRIHPSSRKGNEFRFDELPAKPLLVLSGWVQWADGSEFRKASQNNGRELQMPSLEYKDEKGLWRTLMEDLGLPAGKPKTFAVELPRVAKEMRIVSNLDVHWTDVFLTEARELSQRGAITPARADLRFRGFSRVKSYGPEIFTYANPLTVSMWNPTPGHYTRYGDVTELVESADDRFVIMGSGDELTLRFDPSQFPAAIPGRNRSYILAVDGWAKDRDANTAFSQSVEPLPFHRMSQYPYASGEQFPDDPSHRAWRSRYNTRPALKLVRPLTD